MRLTDLFPSGGVPKPYRPRTTSGQGGPAWRWLVLIGLGILGGLLVTNVVLDPTKRALELLAAVIFLGFVLVAHPLRAYLFALILIPFPMFTTVGSTSTLLIFAVAGLTLMKAPALRLASPFVNKQIDLAIMAWSAILLISLYQMDSKNYPDAIRILTAYGSAIVLFYLTIQLINTKEQLHQVLRVLMGISIVLAIISILQFIFPTKTILPSFFRFSRLVASSEDVRSGMVRAFATFSGYGLYAEFVAICIVIQYLLMRIATTLREKTIWAIGLVILLVSMFTTITRAGPILLAVGFLYMLVIGEKALPRKVLLRTLFVVLAVSYLLVPFSGGLVDTMFERISTIGIDDSSVQSRSRVMDQAFQAFLDKPIRGHGPYIPYDTFKFGVTTHIHSLYMHLAYTVGLPGLLAFLWLLTILFRISFRDARDTSLPPDLLVMNMGLHVILVMWIVDQIKVEYTREALTMHLSWLYFGLIVASWKISNRYRAGSAGAAS